MKKQPVFENFPNMKPIDRRKLKKLDGKYTEEIKMIVNPFFPEFSFMGGHDVDHRELFIERRLFKYNKWINMNKRITSKRNNIVTITTMTRVYTIYNTHNEMLKAKLGK